MYTSTHVIRARHLRRYYADRNEADRGRLDVQAEQITTCFLAVIPAHLFKLPGRDVSSVVRDFLNKWMKYRETLLTCMTLISSCEPTGCVHRAARDGTKSSGRSSAISSLRPREQIPPTVIRVSSHLVAVAGDTSR